MPKTFEFSKYIIMFNGVLLVAIIATWILKVTSLPKLYHRKNFVYGIDKRFQIQG